MNDIALHDLEWSDRLQDLLDGDLNHAQRVALESHMAGCTRCRSQYAKLKRVDSTLRSKLDPLEPSPSFDQQLFARIHALDTREMDKARRRLEAELQQNLQQLAQSSRRNWISLLAGALAGLAMIFALLTWLDAADVAPAVANLAQTSTGFGTLPLLNTLLLVIAGSAIGAGVARWLTAAVE